MRPVAFSRGPYWTGFRSPSEPGGQLTFADEGPPREWSDYSFEIHGHDEVTALYAPWQHLFAGEAVAGGKIAVPLSTLAGDPDSGARSAESLRTWASGQDADWRTLNERWQPVLLLLVRLQNRYWPEITRRSVLLFDTDLQEQVDPFDSEIAAFDPNVVFEREFKEDREGLVAVYHYLVDRGLSLDPHDGLTMLRRARPRAFHTRWRGAARQAQDFFDAAEVVGRFLTDLDGHRVPPPTSVPMDGRQDERAQLYERGPAGPWSATQVVHALQDADLYPHGVHVVHEGASERAVVEILVASLLGSGALDEVSFTDLGGAAKASVLPDLVGSLDGYARKVAVIIDSEAHARQHVEALVRSGGLPEADVLLFATSLEEANASDAELVRLTIDLAEADGCALPITSEELRSLHDSRVQRAGERGTEIPGLAGSLQILVERKTTGTWKLRKADLAEVLGVLIARDLDGLREGGRRPILDFVADRMTPTLNRPRPVGPS